MVGDIVGVVVKQHVNTVTMAATFYYEITQGGGSPDLQGFSSDFTTLVLNKMMALQTSAVTLDDIICTVVHGPNKGQQFVDSSQSGSVGQVATAGEDLAYALIIQRTDGTASRDGRGRLFLGGVADTTFSTEGRRQAPDPAQQDLADAMKGALTDSNGATYRPVLFHRDPPGTTPINTTKISQRAGIRKHRRYKD